MTPAQVSELKAGDWILWSPTIWSEATYGKVVELHVEGVLIEWEDGHTSILPRARLAWATFHEAANE